MALLEGVESGLQHELNDLLIFVFVSLLSSLRVQRLKAQMIDLFVVSTRDLADYAAVLTRKVASVGVLAGPATGRFTFQKRHLYYSLMLPSGASSSAAAAPPRYIQFLSEDGNILEEQELSSNDYYNATGKVAVIFISLAPARVYTRGAHIRPVPISQRAAVWSSIHFLVPGRKSGRLPVSKCPSAALR